MGSPHSLDAPTPRARAHVDWIDATKGIGIFLVVLAHVMRGLKLDHTSALGAYVDRAIYSFHMPLFFLVAGFFAARSASRGLRAFVTDKLRTIAYPYFVWSILQGTIQIAMGSRTNTHLTWRSLAAIPIHPIMQFWFLYALFLILMLFAACHQMRVPGWGVLALGVGLSLLSSTGIPPRGLVHSVTIYFIYFAVGLYFSESLRSRVGTTGPLRSFTKSLVGYGALAVLVLTVDMRWPLAVLGGVLGTVATLLLARGLVPIAAMRFLQTWGERSLQIFVAHSIFSAAVRIALHRIGIQMIALHVIVGTAAGILVPLGLSMLADRLGFSYLFRWPLDPDAKRAAPGLARDAPVMGGGASP